MNLFCFQNDSYLLVLWQSDKYILMIAPNVYIYICSDNRSHICMYFFIVAYDYMRDYKYQNRVLLTFIYGCMYYTTIIKII